MHFKCGGGTLYGIFLSNKESVDNLIASGKEIYFGEVLGKHSEISDPLTSLDVTLVTTDLEAVEMFKKHDMAIGYNPFNYITR